MKFLVCYDEAASSAEVVEKALAHAKVWNASLEIVKTLTREQPLKHSDIIKIEEELESAVGAQIKNAEVAFNTQLLVTSRSPGEKLVDFADQQEVDLIFIGVIKKSKVGKLLFGSTAQYVILNASCPVVSIKL